MLEQTGNFDAESAEMFKKIAQSAIGK